MKKHKINYLILSIIFILFFSCNNDSYKLYEDIVYSSGLDWNLSLDIAVPKTKGPHPIIVYFYGSGFYPRDRKENFSIIPEFISNGYAIAFITYRGIPDFQFPAPIYDAKESIRWLRSHAEEYGINPELIVAQGFSSGAYLSLMLALTNPEDNLEGDTNNIKIDSSIKAAICHSAPTDFTLAPNDRVHSLFLKGSLQEKSEIWEQASPINYIDKNDAPILYLAGTDDHIVISEHWIRLNEKIRAVGNPLSLVVRSNTEHERYLSDECWVFLKNILK